MENLREVKNKDEEVREGGSLVFQLPCQRRKLSIKIEI